MSCCFTEVSEKEQGAISVIKRQNWVRNRAKDQIWSNSSEKVVSGLQSLKFNWVGNIEQALQF